MAITVTVNRTMTEAGGMQNIRYRADTDDGEVHLISVFLNPKDDPEAHLVNMQSPFNEVFKGREIRDSIKEYFDGDDIINKTYKYATRPDVTTALVLQAMRSGNLKEVLQIKPIIDWAQANLTEEYMQTALGVSAEEYTKGMDRFNAITPAMENVLNNDKRLRI